MKKAYLFSLISLLLTFPLFSYASTTVGTIDSTNRYAWSENAGWIDFGTTAGAVTVTDSALAGSAFGENIGWISLNCSNTSSCGSNAYAVANNGSGALSGYAWSENAGWINFAPSGGGVSISTAGVFSGSAYGENVGWIDFSGDHPAMTDWRPASVRNASAPAPAVVSSGGGGGISSGGGSVSPAVLATLLTPSTTTTAYLDSLAASRIPGCPAGYVCARTALAFSRDLSIGSIGADVKALQAFLNSNGFVVAASGAGSPGFESAYFGLRTEAALAKYQAAHGITPSIGYFGPKTRAYIAGHSQN